MPPYPDKAARGSTPSCEYVPVSAATHINSMQNTELHKSAKVENGKHPLPDPGLPLSVPYLSGDSDSEDLPSSAPDLSCFARSHQPSNHNQTNDANKLSNRDASASAHPRDAHPEPQATPCKSGTSASLDQPPEEKPHPNGTSDFKRVGSIPSDEHVPAVKSEDIAAQVDSNSPDCILPASAREESPSDCMDANSTNPCPDELVVSKTCLDGVVEHLSNRISELEHIRERKKARVDRLSSTAYVAQSSALALWPQAVAAQRALTAPNATMVPPSQLGVMPGATSAGAPGCPTSTSGTPFVQGPPDASGSIPAPPPPPRPDSGDRKQSRYWTADEHQRFLAAIKTCGPKNYVQIAEIVGTRNAKQVRTHAQKFQKKLEREEAKRRENLQRHGAHPGAPAVSAAAVAAVAAAAAAMQQGAAAAHHLTCESSAHRGFAPPFLLPFQAHGPASARGPFRGTFPVPPGRAASSADGSSSTNDVSNEHQRSFEPAIAGPSAQNAAVAAVAAEAASLGGRIFAQPVQGLTHRTDNGGSTAGPERSAVVTEGRQKAAVEIAPTKNGENGTHFVLQSVLRSQHGKGDPTDRKELPNEDTLKPDELSKDSNSAAESSGKRGEEEICNRELSSDGIASQPQVGDTASRFRSCDELSEICAVVKKSASPNNGSVAKSVKMQSSRATGTNR